jgi:hypothetical protein
VIRQVLDGAGFPWATPYTFRRTIATLFDEAGLPIASPPTSSATPIPR